MQKGLEINFYDLFRHILKKWTILLAFVLVFGLAANFYGYRRAASSAEEKQKALEQYTALSTEGPAGVLPEQMTGELAELRDELTEEERSFVEATAKLYMYRLWASEKINRELIVGEPDGGDLEIVQTLYYANEGVDSAIQVMTSAEKSYYNVLVKTLSGTDMSMTEKELSKPGLLQPKWLVIGVVLGALLGAAVIAFAYLVSGKLRTPSDMESPYGIPVLAVLGSGEDAKLEQVARGIARLMKERKLTTLAISMADTQEAKTAAAHLREKLEAQCASVRTVPGDAVEFIEGYINE